MTATLTPYVVLSFLAPVALLVWAIATSNNRPGGSNLGALAFLAFISTIVRI